VETRLTILQLTHQGDGAGSTQSIFDLSQALQRRGHRVILGCRAESLLARWAKGTSSVEHAPLVFTDRKALGEALANLMLREGVDVVNSHATRDRRALTMLRWQRRLPQGFVVTRRTMPRSSRFELFAVGHAADGTIAVSHAVARELAKRWQPKQKITVVPNGILLGRLDASDNDAARAEARATLGEIGDRPIVSVLARRKDQDVLIESLARIERPLVLALVGLEADETMRRLAAAVPERHRVVFVPFHADPVRFYRIATVAALPSRIEGLSQSLLEAMALGLPVVASDAGGNPDLVTHERTGLLVPPLDRAAWALALTRLLEDGALRERVGQAGRELVRREFTIERTAERTEAVYRAALVRRQAATVGVRNTTVDA
jgi:glycosyltransferase involved in cell wall biosynthesis